MDNTVKCPNCGSEIAISEVLRHQITDQVRATIDQEHQKELATVRKQIATAKKQAEEEFAKSRQTIEQDLLKKFQEKYELDVKNAREEAEENRKQNKSLKDQIVDLMKQMREAQAKAEDARMEMEKRLVEEQEKIRQEAAKKAEEAQHLKLAEMQKQLEDTKKALDDARRKSEQGSQQTQGEVFELELEELLRKEFPNDVVSPVGKGVRGGDIIQEVWDRNGNNCGKILWELKNTKAWSQGWIDKLKQDQREIHAETAILVTEVLPTGSKSSGFVNGIWVSERHVAICLAAALRANLIQLHYTRQSVKGKNEKMEVLYAYLSGTEFKHRVEAIVDAFSKMQEDIEKEKRYFMLKWARDEKNIRRVIDSTYGMHGDLKSIVGGALPQIKGIEEEPEELELISDGVIN